MSAEEEKALRGAMSREVTYQRGRTIVRAKTELDVSNLLLEGFVYRYKDLKDGTRQTLQLAVPGDFIDLHSLLLVQLDHNISSFTDCRVGIFSHESLRLLIAEHQHLGRLLWLSTVVDAAIHREWMLSLVGVRACLGWLISSASFRCALRQRG